MISVDEILALAVKEARHRSFEMPSAERFVAFLQGSLDEERARALLKAAASVDAIRFRLSEAIQVVETFERGDVPGVLTPFGEEVQAAWHRSHTPRHNLAADSRPFVGREADEARLEELLRGPHRLISLTGPAGMGKSRLARRVGLICLDVFPDGVWEVDCAELSTVSALNAALAKCFGLDERDAESVTAALSSKRALLLFDGLEKSAAIRREVPGILRSEGITILATSRESTRFSGEARYRLKGFTQGETAISLFEAAARQVLADFQISRVNQRQLRVLCGRLMGVPLALTVAAGCLGQQDLSSLLANTPVAQTARQGVVHSLRLMESSDLQNLRRLAVFVGSFGLADVQAVLGGAVLGGELRAMLRDLEVRGLLESRGGEEYRLLDSVKDGLKAIAPGREEEQEVALCMTRHTAHYATRASEIGALMRDGQWARGIDELGLCNANIRKAIRQAVAEEDGGALTRLADGIARTYFEAGYVSDFKMLTAAAGRQGDDALKIRLLGLQGALASLQSDEAACTLLWRRRLRLARRLGDLEVEADTLTDLAWQQVELGDIPGAMAYLDQAATVSEQAQVWELIATVHVMRARVYAQTGDAHAARQWLAKTEAVFPQCKARDPMLFVYQSIAIVYQTLGDRRGEIAAVVRLLREATEGRRAVLTGWSLRQLGPHFERQRRLDLAARCFVSAVLVHNEYATKHRKRAEHAFLEFEARYPELASTIGDLRRQPLDELVREVVAATATLG